MRKDPWPDQDLIRPSLNRAEMLATADPSKRVARLFYEALRQPLAVSNCEAERLARLITLGIHLDGDKLGNNTAFALEAFEPNVMWERQFLAIRKACYIATKNPKAEKASRDLDEFMGGQAFTSDVSALARVFKANESDRQWSGYSIEPGTKYPRRLPHFNPARRWTHSPFPVQYAALQFGW